MKTKCIICAVLLMTCGYGMCKPTDRQPRPFKLMPTDGQNTSNIVSGSTHVPITDVPFLVMPSNGNWHVMCQMYPLDSIPVSQVLSNCTVFQIRAFDPKTDKFPILALVLKEHIPLFLDSDLSTAAFITQQNPKIENREQAKRLILAFCDLRGYRLRDGLPPELADSSETRDPAWRSNWSLQITEKEGLWTIACAIETKITNKESTVPVWYAYTFAITPTGVVNVQQGKLLLEGLKTK